jgi:hypothetical protein
MGISRKKCVLVLFAEFLESREERKYLVTEFQDFVLKKELHIDKYLVIA